MREDLLHYFWKFRNFNSPFQYTSSGERVEVIHPGTHNHDAGPDFFNARVRIGNLEWAGNVEIHVKASDWVHHGHSSDRAYDNVILHVVYEDDKPEKLGVAPFPTLQLKGNINVSVLEKYELLRTREAFVPCALIINNIDIDKALINSYLDRLFVEKLQYKLDLINDALASNRGSWEETFYQLLVRSFGLGKNRLPFELLARSIPLSIIEKERNDEDSIDALFFGQAGFLKDVGRDSYSVHLKHKYETLRQRYGLEPIDDHLWKFSRLRPGNFPTLRIAQLAALYRVKSISLGQILKSKSLKMMYRAFRVRANSYWANHSKFGRSIQRRTTNLGSATVDSLLINAVLPFLFAYGRANEDSDLEKRVFELMGSIRGESNSIVSKWNDLGLAAGSAVDSQALLHLKKHYCDHKKCLSCAIGNALLS